MFVQATTPLALGVYDSHPLPARYTIRVIHYLCLCFLLFLAVQLNPFHHPFCHHLRKDTRPSPVFPYSSNGKLCKGGGGGRGLGTIGLINDVYPQLMAIGLFLCC